MARKHCKCNCASRHALTLLAGFLLICGLSISGLAQGGASGAIAGTVKDANGAAIANAQVDIVNQSTGITARTVTTNANGGFNVTLLPIGFYKVVVAASGFNKTEASEIKVNVTETTNVTMSLKVGAVTEAVTISDAATPIQLSSATTGQTVGSQTIAALPLSTRNFLTLLTLSAGANTELFDSAALGRGKVTINVNGQRPSNNNYQLEGINANDLNLPVLDNVPLPNPQTIQEFKTQTSLYDASQGRNGGGNIQVALKSGSDKYHGDAFEFFRNDVLNANDFFNNRAGVDRPVFRQNQYGGTFGGPVPGVKDFFFFGNYQGTRAASGAAAGTHFSTNIPALPTNRAEANLRSIFFPGGLPVGFTRLDPSALAFLNLGAAKCPGLSDGTFCIPSGGTPGVAGTAVNLGRVTRAGLGTFADDQFTLTMDKQLTAKDKISGRWFYSENSTVQPYGGTRSSLPLARDIPAANRFLKLGWTRVISSNMVNDFRFGFNRFRFAQTPTEPILLTDIGATRGNSGEFPAAYRINITGGGAFSLGTDVNDDRGGSFNTFVWGDDLSYTRGKHQFRAGFEADRYQLNRFNRFATRGSLTFRNTAVDEGGVGIPALSGFQNFLLGRVTGTQGGAGFFNFYFRATDLAAYVQDDWKITPRLTLNLGVRWEGLSVAHEKFGFGSNFLGNSDGTPGPITIIHPSDTPKVATPGISSCTLLHCFDKNNFAPRIGFAWDAFGNQRTVLRGGYGIYYMRTSNQPLLQTSSGLPFAQSFSAAPFTVTAQNPFPSIRPLSDFPLADQQVPRLTGFNATTGAPVFSTVPNNPAGAALQSVFFFPVRNFRSPYGQQWNLTVQHEFVKNWVMEVGYVGTRGVGLLGAGGPLNPAQICTTARPCVIPSAIASTVTVPTGTPGTVKNSDGSITITQSTAANRDARVLSQYMGLANGLGAFVDQAGESTYHGLQVSVTHRFSQGLYFQAAYTWSKTLDNGSGSTFVDEINALQNSGDLENQKDNIGLADFDRTHRLVISYNYDLPFARWAGIENRGFGKLAHGWSLNGVTTFQSGTPFNIYDTSALTLQDPDGNNGFTRATLAPGKTLNDVLTSGDVKSRLDAYVNFSAFLAGGNCVNAQNQIVAASNAACTGLKAIGNVSRNRFRGPFQQNWDLSLIKTTKVTESKSVEFRAELFNVWNHAAFQSPQAPGDAFGNYGIVDVAGGDSSILATANRPRIIQFALKFNF